MGEGFILPDERAGGGHHDAVCVQGRPALAVEAHVSVPPSAPRRAHLCCDARAVLAVAQRQQAFAHAARAETNRHTCYRTYTHGKVSNKSNGNTLSKGPIDPPLLSPCCTCWNKPLHLLYTWTSIKQTKGDTQGLINNLQIFVTSKKLQSPATTYP